MFLPTVLFVLVTTHPEHNLENCGKQIEIDPRYDINLNRTNLQKSMFYCHYNLITFNSIVLDEYNKIYDEGKYNCDLFTDYFNSIINGLDDENVLKCRYAYSTNDRYKNKRYLLAFQNSFYCKKGIEQLNFMVFNTGGIISCTDYGFIQYESSDKCKEELYDNHNFEHLIRCASSEFGFPELPFRGKCICLAGSTGSHCQFSDQNTCNCNGKALSDGYCECDEGYEGFYCEVKKRTITSGTITSHLNMKTSKFITTGITNIITTTRHTPGSTPNPMSTEKVKLTTETQIVPRTVDKKYTKEITSESILVIALSNSNLETTKNDSLVTTDNKKRKTNSDLIIGLTILGVVLIFLIKIVSVNWNYSNTTVPITSDSVSDGINEDPPTYEDINNPQNKSSL